MSADRDDRTREVDGARPAAGLPSRLLVELVIGLGFALILVIVAWASSNAIRFVYGGY
jgi:hypothetical protein